MAWERGHEIRVMMLLEAAVTRCLERVEHRTAAPVCDMQPPAIDDAKG